MKREKDMRRKARIKLYDKTDIATVYSVQINGDSLTEFDKFVERYKNDSEVAEDLAHIMKRLEIMLCESGFMERKFRPESKMNDNVCALPIEKSKLRLYYIRISDAIIIVGNGGKKKGRTYQEDDTLNGYILDLRKIDKVLKEALKAGIVSIEKQGIANINNMEIEL